MQCFEVSPYSFRLQIKYADDQRHGLGNLVQLSCSTVCVNEVVARGPALVYFRW